MLSSSNISQKTPDESSFDKIISTIKKKLTDKYKHASIQLDEELSDEQIAQIEKTLDETEKEWEKLINWEDFLAQAFKEFKIPVSYDSDSEGEDKKEEDEEQIKKREFEKAIPEFEKIFSKIRFACQLTLSYNYKSEAFKNFVTSQIKKSRVVYLRTNTVFDEDFIADVINACKDLPEEYISLIFSNNQIITEHQAKKILSVLKSINRFYGAESKSDSISVSTAKKLLISPYADRLMIEGKGNYHEASSHAYTIRSFNMNDILNDGLVPSDEEIEFLTNGLIKAKSCHEYIISQGTYAGERWQTFFTVTLGDGSPIYSLNIGGFARKHELTISDEVLISIFDALKTNNSVWKLYISIEFTPAVFSKFAEMLSVNEKISEITFSNTVFKPDIFSQITNALIANPKSKVSELILNHNWFGDACSESIGKLISAFPILKKLRLGGTGIGALTCTAIGNALKKNTTLKELSVFENPLDNNALMGLAEGIMMNDTLSSFHALTERQKYSNNAVQNYLNCCVMNYSLLEKSISLLTRENVKRSESITHRNNALAEYRRIKKYSEFTVILIVLFQAHYQKHPLFLQTQAHFEHIASFFLPKESKVKLHLEIISKNILNRRWETGVNITVTQNWQTRQVRLPLFNPWDTIRNPDLIAKVKSNQTTEVDFSMKYIDLELAAQLADALRTNTAIVKLNLMLCNLSDDEFKLIAEALLARRVDLTILNLDINSLTEQSVKTLCSLIEDCKVKHIFICKNKGLSNNPKITEELRHFANCQGEVKIHFGLPLVRIANGFFKADPARQAADPSPAEEKTVASNNTVVRR